MSKEPFEPIIIEDIRNSRNSDIGWKHYLQCGGCLIQKIIPYQGKIIVGRVHSHPFQESYFTDKQDSEVLLFKNEVPGKIGIHKILCNEVYPIRENVPHQLVIARNHLYIVAEGTREYLSRNTTIQEGNLAKKAMEKGKLKEFGWLQKSVKFKEEINSGFQIEL